MARAQATPPGRRRSISTAPRSCANSIFKGLQESMMRAIGRWTTGSALAVLAMTAASAQDRTTAPALSAAPDPAAFREPPADTRPNTLYFWMNGTVTREGIDADLTAMRDIGLGGALMFDGSNDVPKGPVNYISPHWLDLMTHMAAKEIGRAH